MGSTSTTDNDAVLRAPALQAEPPRQFEDARRQKAATHQALLDALPGHLALLDAEGVIVAVNEAWHRFSAANGGGHSDYYVGQNYALLCDAVVGVEAEEAAGAARCIRAVLGRAGAQESLEYACHSPTEQRWFRLKVTGLAASLGDPASGGAVVMHEDISERRRAETAARQTSALLQAVVDGASDHVFVKDAQLRYLLCNRAMADFWGLPAEQMIGQDNSSHMLPEESRPPAESDREVLESGRALTAEYTFNIDGQTRHFLASKTPYRDEFGRVIGLIGISRDITERIQVEQERERERLLLRTLIDAMPDAVYSMDKAARGVVCNPAAARAFGVASVDDLVGKTAMEVFAPDLAACRYAEDLDVLAGHAVVRREVLGSDHRGQPAWSQVTKLPLRDGQGEILGLVGIHRDITQEKRALAQADRLGAQLRVALANLGAEHARLAAAQAVAKIGNWEIDLGSGSAQWSEETHRILQTDPALVTPGFECYMQRVHPDERAATRADFERAFEKGTDGVRERRLLLPDGTNKIIEERWQVDCGEHGRPLRVLGTCQDITERKQAEWTLRQHEALLGMVVRLARIGAWAVDLVRDVVLWSDEVCAIHDVPPGTMPTIEEAMAYYSPECAGIVAAAAAECARQGTPFDLEAEIVTAAGRRVWVRTIGEAIHGPHGEIHRIQGAFQDLSERKQAEQEVRQLAVHLSDTIESITDGFYTMDRDWRITHVNAQMLSMVSRRREDVIGRVLWDEFPSMFGTSFEEGYRRAMNGGAEVTIEAFFGPWSRWISAKAFPSEGGLVVQVRDVSAERAARRHLELLEASVSQLNDVVIITDTVADRQEKRILFVNQAFVRTTGHAPEDVVGKSPALMYGPLTDPAEVGRMLAASARPEAVQAELLIYRKNGETFWAQIEVVPVRVQDEAPTHFVIIARDITERRQAREALDELTAEVEARVEARTAEANLAREEPNAPTAPNRTSWRP